MVAPTAAYDEIADWYEREFLPGTAAAGSDPLGIGAALDDLLGQGRGICLEIGCTDMPAYPTVLAESARVLAPSGRFVHIGVHPCFCGGFADRSDPAAIVIRPGYRDGHWTKASWTTRGVRDKVGATHLVPLQNPSHGV